MGFLQNPDDDFGGLSNPNARSLGSLIGTPFLGLVGEAGSGKTDTLKREYQLLAPKIIAAGDSVRFITLRDISNGSDLDREIFDSTWFGEWQEGRGSLHLFLDALDEGYRQLSLRLLTRLSGLPLQRLYLKIACRTAYWPTSFEREVPRLLQEAELGPDSYAVYELLPLRRVDVEVAAEAEGLNPAAFVAEVVRKGTVPFASKPVTLRFLLRSLANTGTLPSSSTDLYIAGCANLATEGSAARHDTGCRGRLNTEKRNAICERIAALTILSNHQAIWTGNPIDRPASDLALADLGGPETLADGMVDISEDDTLEVLGSGIFSSRGESRFGWSHQTFGEFLAARYLIRTQSPVSELLSLITTPDQVVRPQLAAVAAWLASMECDVKADLMESNPAVLLQSDSAALEPDARERLVESLLRKFDSVELLDADGLLERLYDKLLHPDLADQLKAAIATPELGVVAKREAIAMARACRLDELSGFLTALALDAAAPLLLRIAAANTISGIGDAGSRRQLLPLADGVPEDHDDELKGAALSALWPNVLPIEDLLPMITRRKRANLYGLYFLFLNRFPSELPESGLPAVLRWIAALSAADAKSITFRDLAARILNLAWDRADHPAVMEALAHALRSSNRVATEDPKTNWHEPIARRRLLVEHLLQAFKTREELATGWPWHVGVPVADDFEWLVARLGAAEPTERPMWLELLSRTFRLGDAATADALFRAANVFEAIREEFAFFLGSVDLGSERAERDRRAWRRRQDLEHRPKPARLDGQKELARLLNAFDDGRTEAWSWIPRALAITVEGVETGMIPPIDLLTTPGWDGADPATRGRLIETAARFLEDFDPKTVEWLATNTWPQRVFAAIAALTLLKEQAPDKLSTISSTAWERLAPAIIAFPFFGDNDDAPVTLRKLAFAGAPAVVLATLETLIDADDAKEGITLVAEHLGDFWCNDVAALLLRKVETPRLKDGTFQRLLRVLLDHRDDSAIDLALKYVTSRPVADPAVRDKVVLVAVLLLIHYPLRTWPLVWTLATEEHRFAHDFFVAFAREERPRSGVLFEMLTAEQTADLYILLSDLFPHSTDRRISGFVGPEDEGRMLRDSLLGWLQNRGTSEACGAIADIARRMPHLPWLKSILHEGNRIRRQNMPGWPTATDILKLTSDSARRLVRDASDLMRIVMEALQRLEAELQGETPAVVFLWDQSKALKICRPKPEEHLSDYVKLFLDRDLANRGVVANREVQIHRGERTDIRIDAVREGHDVVTVIMEVKGCWNPGVMRDQETQLVGKYLAHNRCNHGLYLVGWFDCDAWDNADPRWQHQRFGAAEALQTLLAEQAVSLSTGDLSVRPVVLDARLKAPR